VHRPADQKTVGRHRAQCVRRDRVVTKVHTIGAACESDVDAVVHDHARSRSAAQPHKIAAERGQIGGLEIAFAQLDEIDIGLNGPLRLIEQPPPSRLEGHGSRTQTMTIGDQAEHGTS